MALKAVRRWFQLEVADPEIAVQGPTVLCRFLLSRCPWSSAGGLWLRVRRVGGSWSGFGPALAKVGAGARVSAEAL